MVGAGGLGREVAEVVTAVNLVRPQWDLLGFLDDRPGVIGTTVGGLPVVDGPGAVGDYPDAQFILAVGSTADLLARRSMARRLDLPEDRYATLVHPSASLASSTLVGRGTVVMAGAVTTADVSIGAHVLLMPHVLLTHDDSVGDYATLAGRATLAGLVTVGEGAFVGSGALVRERLTVGAGALIGMGAVVTKDVPPAEVWAGCPAVFRRKVSPPRDAGR